MPTSTSTCPLIHQSASFAYCFIVFICTFNLSTLLLVYSNSRYRYQNGLSIAITVLSDSLNLCTFCLTSMYTMITNGLTLESQSLYICRITSTLGYSSILCSSWLRVTSSLLWKKWWIGKWLEKAETRMIIQPIIVLASLSINCHLLFFNGYKLPNGTIRCFTNYKHRGYIFPIWQSLSSIWSFLVPLSLFILTRSFSRRKMFNEQQDTRLIRKNKRNTWMHTRITSVYFVCIASASFYYAFQHLISDDAKLVIAPVVVIVRSVGQASTFLLLLNKVPTDVYTIC